MDRNAHNNGRERPDFNRSDVPLKGLPEAVYRQLAEFNHCRINDGDGVIYYGGNGPVFHIMNMRQIVAPHTKSAVIAGVGVVPGTVESGYDVELRNAVSGARPHVRLFTDLLPNGDVYFSPEPIPSIDMPPAHRPQQPPRHR